MTGPVGRLRADATRRWRRREPRTAFVFSGGGNLGAILEIDDTTTRNFLQFQRNLLHRGLYLHYLHRQQ